MIFRTVKDRNYMIVSNDTYMKDKELSILAAPIDKSLGII